MEHPLEQLWPSLTPEVKKAFVAVYKKHRRISTSKAVIALRAIGKIAATVLDTMAQITDVPAQEKLAMEDDNCPTPIKTSLCVMRTAERLLLSQTPIDDGEFLAVLAEISVGPTSQKWRQAGFDGTTISLMVAQEREK